MPTKKPVSRIALAALVFGLVSTSALAQDAQSGNTMQKPSSMQITQHKHDMDAMHENKMGMKHNHRMLSRHMMLASVTSIDKKTGVLEVNSEGMDLRVHFPPASLSDVNKGDKITLMLAFRKGDVMAMRKQRMMQHKAAEATQEKQ